MAEAPEQDLNPQEELLEFSDDDEALAALQGAGEAASDDDEDEASAGPKAAGGTKPGHKKFVFVEALGYGVLRHEQHDNLPRKFSSLEAAQDAIAELGSYTKNPKEKRGKAVYQINDGARKGETGKLRSYKVFCLDRATTSEGKRSNDKCQHQFEIQEALTLRGDKFVVDTHLKARPKHPVVRIRISSPLGGSRAGPIGGQGRD